jgi:RNA polymerase subunit RPABC4/transcription elongation factor Spt4
MKKKECPSCAMNIDDKSKVCPICGYEFTQYPRWIVWLAILLLAVIVWQWISYV